MKAYSLIFLLRVYLLHWTAANPARFKNYSPFINDGVLRRVEIIVNSSHIDLSSLEINKIEVNGLNALTGIKSLDLSNNSLTYFYDSIFEKLTNLEELSLAKNPIEGILFKTFIGLNNLKRLDLSNNRLFRLDEGLPGLPKSTMIIIEGNNIDTLAIRTRYNSPIEPVCKFLVIPRSSYENNRVKILRNFRVKLCMTDDGTVRSLEELKQNETLGDCTEVNIILHWSSGTILLDSLGIRKFERGWYKLSVDFIPEIYLWGNKITDIEPELLNDLPVNAIVDLSHNNITTIKKNIMANEHCVALYLDGQRNALQTIEEGAFRNICLYELRASKNSLNNLNFLRTIPDTLEILDLSQNGISEIPPNTFQGFKNLRQLDLSRNNLERIESGMFDDLENVYEINLGYNKIGGWNSELFKGLPQIRKITLNHNKIIKITRDIFSRLQNSNTLTLNFSDNEIDSIEDGSFSNLTIALLRLDDNKIADGSIAKGAFNNCNLGTLILSSNLITHLNGESFSGILGSYELQLLDNPMKTITNFSWPTVMPEEL